VLYTVSLSLVFTITFRVIPLNFTSSFVLREYKSPIRIYFSNSENFRKKILEPDPDPDHHSNLITLYYRVGQIKRS